MNSSQRLSTQSYKGARDFYPEDMRVRNFMFEKWKKVCRKYGFEEYDFPILEPLEIFAAKTGVEIVNEQLFSFEDKAGRKLAMRPEITPGTVRLIAQKYKELTQPIKWFMIGNNWRYEKPQTGRGREFYQLEVNVFGEPSVYGDFEIFSMIIDLMREFGATKDQFEIKVSDRRLINALLQDVLHLEPETQVNVRRLMDKRPKITKEAFYAELSKLGLTDTQAENVEAFLGSNRHSIYKAIPQDILNENEGYKGITSLFELLEKNRLDDFVTFDPSIIRGFDYSDGLVYEVFDKSPVNNRSMFGGERFDKLINIFGDFELPATGFAMGDYTLLEFLKYWKLLPDLQPDIEYFVSVWPTSSNPTPENEGANSDDFFNASYEITQTLRAKNKNTFMWPNKTTKIEKQLKFADKKNTQFAIIVGEKELSAGELVLKNLKNGTQQTLTLDKFFSSL